LARLSGAFRCKWTKLPSFYIRAEDIYSKVSVKKKKESYNQYYQLRPLLERPHAQEGTNRKTMGGLEEAVCVPSIFWSIFFTLCLHPSQCMFTLKTWVCRKQTINQSPRTVDLSLKHLTQIHTLQRETGSSNQEREGRREVPGS
jgi:hypothetical protein